MQRLNMVILFKEHADREHIHYSNLTEDGKLPDLKAGIFWKTIMQGCKINKAHILSLMKPQANGSFLTLHDVKLVCCCEIFMD